MIQPPPQREREHRERDLRLLLLKRTGITLGVILLLGVVGSAWWAWVFLNQKLVPLVESNLSQLLGRPVEIGQLESFSLSSLRFGSSSIPATPTDPDRIKAEAVVVNFDPWQLLFNRTLELNATLVEPNIYIEQAKNGAWVDTRINPPQGGSGFIQTELETIRVRNADAILVPNPRSGSPKGAVTLDSVGGVARFLDQNQRIRFELTGQPTRGGKLEIAGETLLPGGKTTVAIQGQNLQAADLSRLIELPTRLQAGEVEKANITVQFQPGQEQPPAIAGTASLSNVTAQIENIPQQFTNTTGQLKFQGQAIALNNLSTRYGKIPVQISGSLNTLKGYNLTGQVKAVSAKNLLDTLSVESPFPVAGKLQADIQLKGAIRQPVLTGSVSTIDTARIDRIPFKNIAGNFRSIAAPTTPKISFTNLRATPTVGGQITGDGQILLGDKPQIAFNFLAQNLPGNAIAQLYGTSPPIKIGNVLAVGKISGTPGNIKTVAQISAPQATYPGTAEVAITNEGIVRLQDSTFKVAGGVVEATGRYAKEQFEAVVDATGIALNQFSPQLRGQLSASNLRISGTSFAPEDIQAQGQVRFSQGLAVIEQPLTAQIRWNGERIIVQKATATGLVADGTVGVRLQGANAPQITGFNLDVQVRGYNLQDLNLNIPGNVTLVGKADFTGQVTGTPDAPNAIGNLRLRNLSVNNVAFDPVLAGKLNFQAGQKTQLQVASQEDRIAFTLDANNRPTSFFIRRNSAIATGRTQGENLIVDVKDFPVAVLQNLIPGDRLKQIGAIAGEVSGNLAIDLAENLTESTVIGDVAISRPSAGRFTADAFKASIRYEGGDFSLKAGELRLGDSRIDITGDLQAGQDRKFQFQIDFDRARIQNVLQALSIFELQDIAGGLQLPDLAGAEAVQTVSVGQPNTSLLNQLRLFSEIRASLAQQQQQERASAPLPSLAAFNGTISGEIAVAGALPPGLQPSFDVDFELLGQDWQWGTYTVDEAIARGTFEDGVLTLLPLRLDLGDGLIAFTGQLGEDLSGQLRVVSVPVATLQPFLDRLPEALPFDVTGQLNALVTLAGSLENPQAIGEVALVEGSLNQQPIQAAQLSFDYNSARLSFASDVLISGTQPVEFTGSIPVSLPFASVQPDSNQISIQANVQDEGLALLNLFTDRVTWVEGQGRLNLAVQGTLNQLNVTGNVVVKNATLKAQVLPEPLTDVTGTIQLNGDRIVAPGISGQYNNEGNVTAEGVLPIFAGRETDNPLTVSLDNLEVALEGLYQGGVSGNVVITGMAFEPDIGGRIELMDGEIALGGREAAASASSATPIDKLAGSDATNVTPDRAPIELADLRLILTEDVRVTRQPILSFEAAGDLTINGTLDNPRPQGVVKLTGGQVNLFTTQFTLARGEEQTARFTPKGGLDPILDIQLVATVPETTGSIRIPTSPFSGEIADVPTTTNFGTLRTVRVQAAVEGPASELAENLELTSEPNRSEQEIIALLGGSFVNTLSQGDPTLGLAAIAGSTLLGNLQDNIGEIGQAIGIDEIRVFPTIVTDQTSEVSVLGLAVEAIFDITNDFSVSLSRVFAADDPFRYNLLYRLNDQILVRASTNFSGESRAEIEYNIRF
ncbi:translocation/assembly module TamB domain-containing protein [Chroococcidiopsis sp. FACHB-1243]|uniref:translocation/assembly module TamB domain-containing protein n=1 Tax=Chroococcidiopsis sp. [FACHB-1243] TaxID=2692781 RepID=UPI00177AA7AB|nr:translocation/assembly module TamB [Chroococcidiopsis sp. [FACHB-1243]]MBD2307755.1 translocation/assembly module TamB domain-containing protein [Chroococcidiopsis sp. [FACHB-1243]]